MKHLIIYVHPNENSLNHSLLSHVKEILSSGNNEVKIRDLYALHFDPVLSLQDMQGWHAREVSEDVQREQEHILWADQITFIYPIWWTGLPAVMKGYFDRVFSYGFAYRYDQGIQKGLLKGKKAVIINTHGKSHEEYQQSGMDNALALTSDLGIFKYSGLEIIRHFFFDKADKASSENIKHWKMQISNAYYPSLLNAE
ncbi:NAD(P)H-dependent oxidoreductase [Chryseobacterium indologenes]|uniref:NAD(P)H-dependent oxidoreductase n=1 Tax=Chryseobacterium indologenes TaxID=253 RepID=UPI0003E08440|nr:NAD(P)H-dependent oxidoreductase [Chryseobacterium indologenes]QPQ52487.1 NAD(P)H-dependent oxidoreductase [Chryseobacterium indologenes]GAE64635.1 putative oxidoreductase [Chryseobacterium indologenes NBRC 14944]SFJ82967.1 NAD(P)H dehydrogenase (quinone) [Chryseobacterium indologenes]SUX51142.1 General stress protein 14 [Chryseobacterium indologenes]